MNYLMQVLLRVSVAHPRTFWQMPTLATVHGKVSGSPMVDAALGILLAPFS